MLRSPPSPLFLTEENPIDTKFFTAQNANIIECLALLLLIEEPRKIYLYLALTIQGSF